MQPQYSLHEQGRIHTFFFEGIDKLHLPWAVEALPSLLHLSLFLFFASLLVFLFNINHTVFSTAVWWVGLCTATYISITFVPFFGSTALTIPLFRPQHGSLPLVC